RVSTATFVNIDLGEKHSIATGEIYTPTLVHAFSMHSNQHQDSPIQTEVMNTLDVFGLIGREKKIFVVLDAYQVKPTEFDLLAKTYHHFGAIDIVYVLVKLDDLIVIRLNSIGTEFRMLSINDPVSRLFPDRLANLSGRPYKVICLENPPLSFRSSDNHTIGIDIDFIDIIANHQHTVVEYNYTTRPIKVFEPWHGTAIDFATYRITHRDEENDFAPLFLPNQHRWCLAVPKAYSRIMPQQILWLYATDLWMLIVSFIACCIVYTSFFEKCLQKRFPTTYPMVNTSLRILRILLLFLLTGYYTAILSSNLGLSQIPTYPRSLQEFSKTNIPLIVSHPESFQFLLDNPRLMSRTSTWNVTQRYNPTKLALLQLCDLFPYTIQATTKMLGKQLSRHHYHLIEQPVKSSICMSPFRRTSPLLSRFQMYIRRLNEAGIWDHVVRKWTIWNLQAHANDGDTHSTLKLDHFMPVYIVGGFLYLLAVGVFLLEIFTHRITLNTPIIIQAITSSERFSTDLSIFKDTLNVLQSFGLYGKSRKVIVLIDMNHLNQAQINKLKLSYDFVGVIDILYVLEHFNKLYIKVPELGNSSHLVHRSLWATVQQLFPDRLANLSGQPYKVACIENRPLTYRTAKNRIVGIDVDFINIIAKHQRTVVEYKYTKSPIKLFTSWYDDQFDLATYRVKHEGFAYPFMPIYFPNQFRWCLAVPRRYVRVIHRQLVWPYRCNAWVLISTIVAFFIFYRLVFKERLYRYFPDAFPIINTPLQILRIMLLFLLTEYYTAKLTAILGLSEVPMYPKTLAEFARSPIPLIVSQLSEYQYVLDNPEVHSKTIEWNFTAKYDPSGLALLQLCDLFPFTIGETTYHLGQRLSHHHYHLIDEPISTSICLSPFRKTSPRLERFQLYVTRLNEAGIWNHLMSKWMMKGGHMSPSLKMHERQSLNSSILQQLHFVPVYVIAGYLYIVAVIIFILEQMVSRLPQRFE
uniref:Ionotropic glutamate receptor L-glutamate and glycine-binding domain-containing protein n=1 Tax=Anopheles dirus TaxID=7168 RepID=A0A182NJ53_9DIPT